MKEPYPFLSVRVFMCLRLRIIKYNLLRKRDGPAITSREDVITRIVTLRSSTRRLRIGELQNSRVLYNDFEVFIVPYNSMSTLPCTEGLLLQCDSTTGVFLKQKNSQLIGNQQFIIMILDNNNIFIKPGSERYVSKLINDWIDTSNTPKKDDERNSGKA